MRRDGPPISRTSGGGRRPHIGCSVTNNNSRYASTSTASPAWASSWGRASCCRTQRAGRARVWRGVRRAGLCGGVDHRAHRQPLRASPASGDPQSAAVQTGLDDRAAVVARLDVLTRRQGALSHSCQSEDAWLEIATASQRRDGNAFQMTTVMSTEIALARSINTRFVGWEVLSCNIAGVKLERHVDAGRARFRRRPLACWASPTRPPSLTTSKSAAPREPAVRARGLGCFSTPVPPLSDQS